ncbi:hypothetical protein KAR28_00020 [Candidatus Parcubacteria bacterium]|nr:hypothetical protein [Candidatus Parcubacteria bacterium]
MKKDQEEKDPDKDLIELILGNTHRCGNCGQPINLTMNSGKKAPNQCSNCGSFKLIKLAGLEKCLILQ